MKVQHLAVRRAHGSPRARFVRTALTLGVVGVLAAGCSSSSGGSGGGDGGGTATATSGPEAALIAAAKKDGSLHAYWSVDAVTGAAVAAEFKKLYGVTLTFDRIPDNGTLESRYASEAKSGVAGADIVMTSDTQFFDAQVAAGTMVAEADWGVPAMANVPKAFVGSSFATAGLFTLNNVLANTGKVSSGDIPTTWQQLADPKWKNALLSDDPRAVNVTMSLFAELDKLYGDDYLRALGQQNPQYVQSLVSGAQTIAAGEKKLAFGIGQIHINPLLKSAPSAPVKLVRLAGPTFGSEWDVALSSKSKHQGAAKLFLQWLFSPDGQLTFNKLIGPAVLPGVDVPGFPPLPSDYARLANVSPSDQNRILGLLGLPSQ